MTSTLSWLDYSEQERRQVLDVVDLFRMQDTRDEIGIGVIRDAFADIFFPGTSTIQTRAKYFLFIPWIFQGLEGRRTTSRETRARARQEEVRLINALLKSDDQEGIIGRRARGAVQRLPSTIYWQGLRRWGILLYPGSRDYYIRTIDMIYRSTTPNVYGDDESTPIESRAHAWHLGLPPSPRDFPQGASFALTLPEAEYLRERIISQVPRTLLAHLVDRGERFQPVDVPWHLPWVPDLPLHIQEQLKHAENFSVVIWGAALLYNLMLAELAENDDLIVEYQRRLGEWSMAVEAHATTLSDWSRPRFWEITASGAQIPRPTRRFTDTWLNIVLERRGSPGDLINLTQTPGARGLIHERERSLKRGQARLDNRRALELWNGAAGSAPLTYRWFQAQRITFDILHGLGSTSDA